MFHVKHYVWILLWLHLLNNTDAEKIKSISKSLTCDLNKCKAGILNCFIIYIDTIYSVELVECLSNIYSKPCYDWWFIFFRSILNNFWEADDLFKKINRCFICKYRIIDICKINSWKCWWIRRFICFSKDTWASSVCILNIWTCFTVKVEEFLPTEAYIFDSLIVEIVEYNCSDTNYTCNLILVLKIRILLIDCFLDLRDSLKKNVLSINNISISCWKLCTIETYKSIRNMYELILSPFISEKLNYLKYLSEWSFCSWPVT